VVSLVAELRAQEQQAAQGSCQRKTHVEEGKVIDASPAAITLAPLLTDEELDSLEKRAGDGEIARGGRPGDQMSQALNRLRAMVDPAQVFPANAAAADRRPRMDGVICGSGIRPERSCFRVGRNPSAIQAAKDIKSPRP